MSRGQCRFCGAALSRTFVDLGMSPLSNAYLEPSKFGGREAFYPLHVFICEKCLLVQLEEFETPEEIFSDYAYFSSFSEDWLAHCRRYVASMIKRLRLDKTSLVIEVASNDGYLLQYFLEQHVPSLGIEPAANVAKAAEAKGVPTIVRFFGRQLAGELAKEGKKADLLLGNNVLAHVPDLNDFVAGLGILLKDRGVITMEFPHLLRLIEGNQFDTIYHEHFSYFSFLVVERVFARHGMTLFDAEELPTHGGSLRIYARHSADKSRPVEKSVDRLRKLEIDFGLGKVEGYCGFSENVREAKRMLLDFLIRTKREGKSIVAYGAAAKGNTLLNYCGIREDFIDYVVDRSPHKQGKLLPGTHIPIHPPERISETRPEYVLILPWNLKTEIMRQMDHVCKWGGKFVVPIPRTEVLD